MSNNVPQKCRIWDTDAEVGIHIDGLTYTATYRVDSVRAGGEYIIDSDADQLLRDCDDRAKARLTTWLLEQRKLGVTIPKITEESIENVKLRKDLPIDERADRLLATIEKRIAYNGQLIHFCEDWIPLSESINPLEADFLVEYLREQGWLAHNKQKATSYIGPEYELTVKGYIHLSQLKQANPDSIHVFVAMWFGDPDNERENMDDAYEKGFKPAIEKAGYVPVRSDKMDHLDKIDDKIIAAIRRSRFIVADFTHGDSGARGGVYFEAGFAKGLNIEVIFACRKGNIENVHFDTRQYRHIIWETPEELRVKLLNSIRANIGQGPKKSQQ